MTLAIRTEDLTKDYPVGFWRKRYYRALDRLSLEVKVGEAFGLLGPNGAGKTTTLKLLFQLVFPTAGGAEILGRPVGDVGVKRRLGYLPENPYFYDHLTAEELLDYFAALFGYRGVARQARVGRLLDQVGVGAERRLPLRRFSKGMLQRVGLAQALVNDPEVIFLDEPMSGLDPIGRRQVCDLILGLRDEGRTIFFSSHILGDAERLCSRVAVLERGRLVSTGGLGDTEAFEIRGWELVMADVTDEQIDRVRSTGGQVRSIAEDRVAIELPLEAAPERVAADLVASGGRLLSLNPLRDTLEDYFFKQVGRASVSDEAGRFRR